MGNDPLKQKAFEMNIQLIGENLTNFKNYISKTKNKYSIQNFWTFNYDNDLDFESQIKNILINYNNLKTEVIKPFL